MIPFVLSDAYRSAKDLMASLNYTTESRNPQDGWTPDETIALGGPLGRIHANKDTDQDYSEKNERFSSRRYCEDDELGSRSRVCRS